MNKSAHKTGPSGYEFLKVVPVVLQDIALNEIQVMNQLSHPNILQLYEAFENRNQVVLILE